MTQLRPENLPKGIIINMKTVNKLSHGGIMANYRCNAACRHCLYACSPKRTAGYITKEVASSVCETLLAGGCRSVHIGGGEPFLDFDKLLALIETITDSGIIVEYIETNAFWASDHQQTAQKLKDIQLAGANTLCISVDPFHAEFVPVELPLSLATTCQDVGFDYFLWQERFLPMLLRMDRSKTHNRDELEKHVSPNYIYETARSYGVHMGGRAIGIEAEFSSCKPVETILSNNPCLGLLSGNHFHVDLHGRFIPPGCTGIAIPLAEAVNGVPNGKYSVFEALLSGGTSKLLQYATAIGFTPNTQGYTSNCALCFHIRSWISENASSPELDNEHYIEALSNSF